jgi:hypothetical protein
MKIKEFVLTLLLVVLACIGSTAQNNCTSVPATGVCPAPAPPKQLWCASGSSSALKHNCRLINWWGFATVAPGTGAAGSQFEGIDASQFVNPFLTVSPNGGVGPSVTVGSTTEGQYLQSASGYVQAYDKSSGNAIFSNSPNAGPAVPQPFGSLFAPGATVYCNSPLNQGIAEYDRLDSVFVTGNISAGGSNSYYYCLGVSANNSAAGATSTNLLGGGNGKSYWNAYVYSITSSLPKKSRFVRYAPGNARFGTWSDGFYVTWDLLDPTSSHAIGFEVCKLDKADILAGTNSTAPTCFSYIPSYAVGKKGTKDSLIHTLLPADFEGSNPIPSNTAGEYFLAQVNPSNPGTNNPCNKLPCQSNQLAFWTWAAVTSQTPPTSITTANQYTPACYNPFKPTQTVCVPEPGYPNNFLDSVGDQLMHRLAYRVLQNQEYLAAAHTVEEDSVSARTGIRYYKIQGASTPVIVVESGSSSLPDIQDSTNGNSYLVPSVAMDNNGDLGFNFTASGTGLNPTPYSATTDANGTLSTPVNICSGTGGCTATGENQSDAHWGSIVSTTTDPTDDLTFWSTGEYFSTNQTSCCTWQTRIYLGKH